MVAGLKTGRAESLADRHCLQAACRRRVAPALCIRAPVASHRTISYREYRQIALTQLQDLHSRLHTRAVFHGNVYSVFHTVLSSLPDCMNMMLLKHAKLARLV